MRLPMLVKSFLVEVMKTSLTFLPVKAEISASTIFGG